MDNEQNFSMQILTSPTRCEIDAAHAQRETVDIGIPSFRNLTRISRGRFTVWLVLLITIAPLHLIFNSCIYSTTAGSDYYVFIVTEKFLFNFTSLHTEYHGNGINTSFIYDASEQGFAEWHNTTIKATINRYGKGFADEYRHIIFFADLQLSGNNGLLFQGRMDTEKGPAQSDWLCKFFDPVQLTQILPEDYTLPYSSPQCHSDSITAMDRQMWQVPIAIESTFELDKQPTSHLITLKSFALSEPRHLECRLRAKPLYMWITTACTLSIALSLTWILCCYKQEPLITVGDVIDSFLCKQDDINTKSACTLNYRILKNIYGQDLEARPYEMRRERWWRAVGLRRWCLTTSWWFFTLAIATGGLSHALQRESEIADISLTGMYVYIFTTAITSTRPRNCCSFSNRIYRFHRGFGSLNRISMIHNSLKQQTTSGSRETSLILLANMPQVILTITYLFYNALLTIMLLEREWHSRSRSMIVNNAL